MPQARHLAGPTLLQHYGVCVPREKSSGTYSERCWENVSKQIKDRQTFFLCLRCFKLCVILSFSSEPHNDVLSWSVGMWTEEKHVHKLCIDTVRPTRSIQISKRKIYPRSYFILYLFDLLYGQIFNGCHVDNTMYHCRYFSTVPLKMTFNLYSTECKNIWSDILYTTLGVYIINIILIICIVFQGKPWYIYV